MNKNNFVSTNENTKIKFRFLSSIVKINPSSKNEAAKLKVYVTDSSVNKTKLLRILKNYIDILPIKINSKVEKREHKVQSYDNKNHNKFRTVFYIHKKINKKVFILTFKTDKLKQDFVNQLTIL
ncbi:hypothetical protein AB837_00163 [bacterium AB1]|nr:hypothetical protein AB837_00163 [bacterium AB1]